MWKVRRRTSEGKEEILAIPRDLDLSLLMVESRRRSMGCPQSTQGGWLRVPWLSGIDTISWSPS